MITLEPNVAPLVRAFRNRHQHGAMTEVSFRPIRECDEDALRRFFASHTSETIFLRYGYQIKEMSASRAHDLACLDGFDDFALIGLVPSAQGERIIAIGRYCREDISGYAEVAFVVHEDYRHLGIATFLLRKLSTLIAERGFAGITATAIQGNLSMTHVLYEVLGPPPIANFSCGQVTMRWPVLPTQG